MSSSEETELESICRLCLGVADAKISIFRDDFPKMIKIVSGLEVDPLDKLPKNSCLMCAKKVRSAVFLKERILRSHKYLKAQLKKAKNDRSVFDAFSDANSNIEEILIITEPNVYLDESNDNQSLFSIKEEELESDGISIKEKKLEMVNNSEYSNKRAIQNKGEFSQYSKQVAFHEEPSCSSLEDRPKQINKYNKAFNSQESNSSSSSQECPICEKTFSNTTYLKMHLRTHDGPVGCPICGKIYKYKDSLNQHILYYHKTDKNAIICDICGKNFRRKTVYNLHMKRHLNKKDAECLTCGKKFFTSLLLSRHVRQVHTKIKPHICEYCSKNFSRRDQLMAHIRTHSEETPFNCHLCNQKFKQKSCLKNHFKNIHHIQDKLIVYCPKCQKGFTSEHAFNSHFTRMHEVEKCSVCSKVFATKAYLINHFRELHVKTDTLEVK